MTLDRVNLPALVAQWARFVDALERQAGAQALVGDAPTADVPTADAPTAEVRLAEFLAEVAVRHEIAQRLRARSTTAETRDLLADLDAVFREATTASEHCVHGTEVATINGWTSSREWYYWRRPGTLSLSRPHHEP
jgi:hypothetical protein